MGDVEHSFEPTPRRVRVRFGGIDIAETDRALLMMGGYKPPLYSFPCADVRTDLLVPSEHRSHCATRGQATHWTVRAGGRKAVNDAWAYAAAPAGWEAIRDHVAFTWNAMDAWFEEDEEVFVHPRDPHHRVDVCPKIEQLVCFLNEKVETEVDGVVEAPPTTKWTAGIPDRDLV